jgi:di/tricarboxylate transporter
LASAIVLGLLIVATVLLATERLRADVTAMLILSLLMLLGILKPAEALSGFSNQATVTVACMFVISAGLQASGVVQFIGDRLLKHGPSSATALMALIGLIVAPVSAFVNNTAAVAIFLPLVLRVSNDNRISPSLLMMPLSFFAMLGGACTLIGTSTNVLVSSIAQERGHRPFAMFEFTQIGIILLIAGFAYLLLVGRRSIPQRVKAESLTEGFHLNRYLSEVIVLPGSPLIDLGVHEAQLGQKYDLEVLGHVRDKVMRGIPGYSTLHEGDILLIKAPAAALVQLRDTAGIAVRQGRRPGDADLRSSDSALVEAVVTPNSDLEGRTLKRVDFRNRFGATALAIRRHGEDIREKIGHVRLRVGDELLILAARRHLERLRSQTSFVMLEEVEVPVLQPWKATTSVAIVAGVVATAALGLYSIATAAVAGAVAMVITGCIPVRRVYQEIDWAVIFLLAGLIPLGLALEQTGAAAQAADWLLAATGSWGPQVVLGAFFLIAAALTGVMSNNATAALLAPLALTCAAALEVDPRPFLVAVTLAASAAFYTPIGYQTNLLVYGPGGYRFTDFVRVGGPLTVLYWLLATFLVPIFFPF